MAPTTQVGTTPPRLLTDDVVSLTTAGPIVDTLYTALNIQAGDYVVYFAYIQGTTTTIINPNNLLSVGTNLSLISDVVSTGSRLQVYAGYVNGPGFINNWTVQLSAAANAAAYILIFRGVGTAAPVVTTINGTGTSWLLTPADYATSSSYSMNLIGYLTGTILNELTAGAPSTMRRYSKIVGVGPNPGYVGYVQTWYGIVEGSSSGGLMKIGGPIPASANYIAANITLQGLPITIDNFTYKIGETGQILNDPGNVLPIYDVDRISGLNDLNISSDIQSIDGINGSYVSAKYLNGKTINIEGRVIASKPYDEGILDNLRQQLRPRIDNSLIPFYYINSGSGPIRVRYVKPIGFVSDTDRGVALANIPFQIQLASPDVRAYNAQRIISLANDTALPNGQTVVIGGNVEIYPRIYFTVYAVDLTVTTQIFTFTSASWDSYVGAAIGSGSYISLALTANGVTLPAGMYYLDLATKQLVRMYASGNTADYSAYLTTRYWWGLIPNASNVWGFGRPASSTSTEYAAMITPVGAWL